MSILSLPQGATIRPMKAIARTVRYTQDEVHEIREYAELTGEQEAVVLARASIRGLREERFERALMAYLGGASSVEAAAIAGVDRHAFLVRAAERGAIVGDTALFDQVRDQLHDPPDPEPAPLDRFGAGEAAAIVLSRFLNATLLINDHRPAEVARNLGLAVVSCPGMIVFARSQELIAAHMA